MTEGFKARNLRVLAYANGFTLWHYITPDLADDIDASGYFADARDMLRVGDLITINVDRGGEMKTLLRCVSSSGASGITIAKPA